MTQFTVEALTMLALVLIDTDRDPTVTGVSAAADWLPAMAPPQRAEQLVSRRKR